MKSIKSQASQAYRYLRYLIRASALVLPRNVACNVCGWQGRRFISDGWHRHSACPRCRCGIRHRLLMAAFQHLDAFSYARLIEGKHVLHFAPEHILERRLRKIAGRYVTADLTNKRRDRQLDIANMPGVDDGAFDTVIACDVLEHVKDDRRALREIARILRPNGFAVLTVPQKDGLSKTFEDETHTAVERERLFGQVDHLRIYGTDFIERIQQAGLRVHSIDERAFAPECVQRHVLFPPELSARPLATNYRKVFFGQKPCI